MNTHNLRKALGSFVSGITVITSADSKQEPVGVTVSSFCSLSLDPPMVLWCIARQARSTPVFAEAQHFVAHILAHDQWHLAEKFATQGADKFGSSDWQSSEHGIPVLDGCAAHFECARDAVHEGGDHLIITGTITSFVTRDIEPLAYHQGRYALTHRGEQAAQMMALQSW